MQKSSQKKSLNRGRTYQRDRKGVIKLHKKQSSSRKSKSVSRKVKNKSEVEEDD